MFKKPKRRITKGFANVFTYGLPACLTPEPNLLLPDFSGMYSSFIFDISSNFINKFKKKESIALFLGC